jgi:hypothetical protein
MFENKYVHASHFCYFLIIYLIGKSIDPCGKKVGEANTTSKKVGEANKTTVTVEDDYIERYINMWDHWVKPSTKSRKDAIKALSPYVASKREDTYLHLLSDTLECLPDEVVGIDSMMETWIGRYDEMFVMVDTHIREKERERQLLLEDVADMVTDDDDLSKSETLFIEDIDAPPPHTLPPQDVTIPTQAPVDIVDHHHAHDLASYNKNKEHVQNRREADQEKDSSIREKSGSNKLSRITRRQSSKRSLLE